jgi:hypothetical protein
VLDLRAGRTRSLSVEILNGGAINLVIGTGTNEVSTVASAASLSFLAFAAAAGVENVASTWIRFGGDVANLVKKIGLQGVKSARANIVVLLFPCSNDRGELCERSQGGFQVPKLCEMRDHMFLMSEILEVLGHDTKVLAKVIKMGHVRLKYFFDGVDFLHGDDRIFADVLDEVHAGERGNTEGSGVVDVLNNEGAEALNNDSM